MKSMRLSPTLKNLSGVTHVLLMRYPFKVARSVVTAIAVFMVYVGARRVGVKKCVRYQTMNLELLTLFFEMKIDAAVVRLGRRSSWFQYPPLKRPLAVVFTPNAAHVRDGIDTLVSRYRFPYFAGKVRDGRRKRMETPPVLLTSSIQTFNAKSGKTISRSGVWPKGRARLALLASATAFFGWVAVNHSFKRWIIALAGLSGFRAAKNGTEATAAPPYMCAYGIELFRASFARAWDAPLAGNAPTCLTAIPPHTGFDILGKGIKCAAALLACAWYSFMSHDLNLTDRLGLWSDPLRKLQLLRGSFCIIAREGAWHQT